MPQQQAVIGEALTRTHSITFAASQGYPKDTITAKMIGAVKKYFKNPNLTVENMKSVSIAGEGLLKWVLAISKYYDVAKVRAMCT
jgi:hypothetical protein